jgi:hypothetical protein
MIILLELAGEFRCSKLHWDISVPSKLIAQSQIDVASISRESTRLFRSHRRLAGIFYLARVLQKGLPDSKPLW